ncbi:MAG: NADH:flavin oxidoreductase, partial [Armatimonadota bacterium]
MSLDALFSPIRINGLELKNRIVMPPMGTSFADEMGRVTPKLIAYYAARARGGPGLVIVEHTAVHPTGRTGARMLSAFSERDHCEGLRQLFAAVHDAGVPVAIQLNHGGRQASADVIGEQVWAPSAVPCPDGRTMSREMTLDDIAEVRAAFVSAAERAKRAGADAVEIHMAHGYLLCEFLSPYTNKRTDEYGGDLERRCRLPTEVVRAVRETLGADFPILVRISADELIEGGLTTEMSRENARRLAAAGADAVDVSVCLGETAHVASAPYYLEQGHLVEYAEAIKEAVNVPVIAVGRITEPAFADRVIAEGRADLVAVGRALIADPAWPRKAR